MSLETCSVCGGSLVQQRFQKIGQPLEYKLFCSKCGREFGMAIAYSHSLTPGWKPKDFKAYTPGQLVNFSITAERQVFHGREESPEGRLYLDNGSEYKDFPNTKEGWADLCDALKELEP